MPIVTIGIESNGPSPGSDRGKGSAAPSSPEKPAMKSQSEADQHRFGVGWEFRTAALIEALARDRYQPDDELPEGEAEEIEINHMFRRRIAGLRRLPKHERPHALKAARNWRGQALKALREQRARDRLAKRIRLQLSRPAPR